LKNKIILIGGYQATGKSTFARRLSDRCKLPCFTKDTIKEVIGEGFGAENTDVHLKNSIVTFSLMIHIAESFLRVGKVCILESNFRKSESEPLKHLLQKYNCECLTFLFKGDFNIIHTRSAARDSAGERHWVHNRTNEHKNDFKKWHLHNGYGNISIGQTISVDTTIFENVDYEKLFALTENFLLNK
jgi:predicted kinase